MRKDLRPLIGQAVVERDVDVLLLAEAGVSDADMLASLMQATGREYAAHSQRGDKVRLFSRLMGARWIRRQADPMNARMAIWSADIGRPPGILLATAHFVSKNYETAGGQSMLAAEMAKEVSRVEDSLGYQRTVVVGDLNMNPFEDGLAAATALHGVMTRKIAGKRERTVQAKPYRFFYNPMWGFFGDRTTGPAGTYHHGAATVGNLFWQMFDQVLLRPDLMNALQDLEILDRIGAQSLLTEKGGVPDRSVASDHLPLAFRLTLE